MGGKSNSVHGVPLTVTVGQIRWSRVSETGICLVAQTVSWLVSYRGGQGSVSSQSVWGLMNVVALRQAYIQVLWLYTVRIIPSMLHTGTAW